MNLEFDKFDNGVSSVRLSETQVFEVAAAALRYGVINKELATAFMEVLKAKRHRAVRETKWNLRDKPLGHSIFDDP